jgi:hypothetical protein
MPDGSNIPVKPGIAYEPAELVARCNAAFSSQSNFRQTMERKRQLFLPDAAPFFLLHNQTQGQRDRATTIDTYGQSAVRVQATFLFGSIINGDGDWITIEAEGHKGAEDDETKRWLIAYRDALVKILVNEECGFLEQFYAMLLERAAFDNARLYGGDRPGSLPIVNCTTMADSMWEGGTAHAPTVNWFKQTMTAAEWARKFPNRSLGETVTAAAEDRIKRDAPFVFIHGVMDNPKWTPSVPDQLPQQRQFLSFWLSEQDQHLVSNAWLTSNPYTVFRCMRRAGEIMGRGSSDEALEEVQMAQRVRLGVIRGIEKANDPTMLLPDDGVSTPPTNEPNGAIVLRADMLTGRGGDPIRYLKSEGRPDLGQEWLQNSVYGAIDRAFGKDLMTLPREPRMLDSQIIGLQEEQARGIVPMVSPLFGPTGRFIGRIADVAQRARRLPAPPRSAHGLHLHIRFKNPLERASRLAEVRAFTQILGILGQASQFDPSARHAIKVVEGVQYCASILGVPDRLIPTKDELAQLIAADAEAMARKSQMEGALDGSTVAKNFGNAARGFVDPGKLIDAARSGGAANAA